MKKDLDDALVSRNDAEAKASRLQTNLKVARDQAACLQRELEAASTGHAAAEAKFSSLERACTQMGRKINQSEVHYQKMHSREVSRSFALKELSHEKAAPEQESISMLRKAEEDFGNALHKIKKDHDREVNDLESKPQKQTRIAQIGQQEISQSREELKKAKSDSHVKGRRADTAERQFRDRATLIQRTQEQFNAALKKINEGHANAIKDVEAALRNAVTTATYECKMRGLRITDLENGLAERREVAKTANKVAKTAETKITMSDKQRRSLQEELEQVTNNLREVEENVQDSSDQAVSEIKRSFRFVVTNAHNDKLGAGTLLKRAEARISSAEELAQQLHQEQAAFKKKCHGEERSLRASMRSLETDLRNKKEECKDVDNMLAERRVELERTQDKMKEKETELEHVKTEQQTSRSREQSMAMELEEIESCRVSLAGKITMQEQEMDKKGKELEQKEQELDEKRQELEEMKRKHDAEKQEPTEEKEEPDVSKQEFEAKRSAGF